MGVGFSSEIFKLRHPAGVKQSQVLFSHCHGNAANTDSPSPMRLLEEAAVFEVFFDDDVSHGIEHELDVLCVCGARHVGIDLLDVSAQVQVQKLHFDVVSGILVSVGAWRSKRRGI